MSLSRSGSAARSSIGYAREGIDPYPVGYPRTTSLAQLRARFPDLPPDTATGEIVGVTGRVVLNRVGGKITFATLQEGGERLQVMLTADATGLEALAAWKSDVDLGDHVGVTGEVITSKRGELSVRAASWALTSKSLRPLPDKHKGLADLEARVRQRYVDLIVNPEARAIRIGPRHRSGRRTRRPSWSRLRRSGNAGAAGAARWSGGPAVPHPLERARRGSLSADRARALSQTSRGRRN